MGSPRVLLVDDHASFRAMVAGMLVAEGFNVVGEAEDGVTAVARALALSPDLVLLDVQLPDIDGFEVSRRLARDAAEVAVVLTSTRSRADYGARVEQCGAIGFIRKEDLSGQALHGLLASPTL